MGKKLFIVESPAKAKTINKYLGSNYIVQASIGHIRDLPVKEFGIDINNNFKPTYVVSEDKKSQVSKLKKLAKTSSQIILATDPDREGEAIAWHLQHILKGYCKDITRVTFNEISKKKILDSIKSTGEVDYNLFNAQQTRRLLDRIVGYKISPWLGELFPNHKVSAGRVQSVTLMLIVNRFKEREEFEPDEYWNIYADFNKDKDGETFNARLISENNEKLKINTKEESDKHIENIKSASGYEIGEISKKIKTKKPKPPLTTSRLQQVGSKRLEWDGKRIMKIAQSLYEGVTLSDGESKGLITYMRTDSTRINKEFALETLDFIRKKYGNAYAPKEINEYSQSKDNQDAHEAIRPTDITLSPINIKQYLNREQYQLYNLIWEEFLKSQMTNAKYKNTNIEIKADQYSFELKGDMLEFDGFEVIKESTKEDDILPNLEEGERVLLDFIEGKQKFTQPPSNYTESTLIKELDKLGIGRPSTYASIMSVLFYREYIEKENKFIIPTDLGKIVEKELSTFFPTIMDIQFTAEMENNLDKVAFGNQNWLTVLSEFYKNFDENLTLAYKGTKEKREKNVEVSNIDCPKCEKEMRVINGQNGKFLACTGYPECDITMPYMTEDTPTKECEKCGGLMVHQQKKDKTGYYYSCVNYPNCKSYIPANKNGTIKKDEMTDKTCPECGKDMRVVNGQNGKFLACTGYPECQTTLPYIDENTKTKKCDKCGDTMVHRRKKDKSGYFYSCINYPKCENYIPANKDGSVIKTLTTTEKCPKCGKDMRVVNGQNGKFLACTGYPDCQTTLPYIDENTKTKECDKCGGTMVHRQKKDKSGYYYSCSNYPECKNYIPANKDGSIKKTLTTNEKCPKCGKDMRVVNGQNGKFLACTGYPNCKTSKPYIGENTKTKECDKCGGIMIHRQKKDKTGYYYSCVKYPKCKNYKVADKDGNLIK